MSQVEVEVAPENGHAHEPVASANVLEIPLSHVDGEEATVTVDLDNELPADPEEMCTFLENEKCAPNYWLAIALAYSRKNQVMDAAEVLNRGEQAFPDVGDKISFHSCLSWLYLRQLRTAPVSAEGLGSVLTKEQYHRKAMQEANRALELGSRRTSGGLSDLANGALTLASGDFDRALTYFQASLTESGNENLLAQLGKARVLFQKKNYKGALGFYQSVLVGRPNLKPDPRIGIGLCFFHLGDKPTALLAWERAHTLDPDNAAVNSLMGLFHLDRALNSDLVSTEFIENYTKGIKYMEAAFKANPLYSAAEISLSTFLFSKQDMDRVLKLTQRAIAYSDVPALRSEGFFWMARAYHFNHDYDNALEFYEKAEKALGTAPSSNVNAGLAGNFAILPTVGKGLVQLAQDSSDALLTFEDIYANNPRCSEAVLILGLLIANRAGGDPKRKQRAIGLLEKYNRLTKEQSEVPAIEALLTLSQLSEDSNLDQAQANLEDIVKYHDISGREFEIYNNLGTYNYLQGNLDASRTNFTKALEAADSATHAQNVVTVKYNLARLEDAQGNNDAAKKGYEEVLEIQPGYSKAQIRLAFLALSASEDDAADQVKKLLDENPGNMEVRALYAWYLHRRKGRVSDDLEQQHHKRSLVDFDKHDNFSLISLGNLYLAVAREIRAGSKADTEKKDRTYFKAAEIFDKALQIDPYNAFAAQGIAIIFAETKRPELALQIFGKIRESLDDISINLNLGHCLVEMRQLPKAIESYEVALQKSTVNGKEDPQLVTLLGRAWYIRGITEKSIEGLQTSLEYSRRASALVPENLGLKFNVAFVQFQIADAVRRTPANARDSDGIESAGKGLEEAIETLNEIAKAKYPPYPSSDLEQRAIMGQNTLRKQLERSLAEQKEYEQSTQSKLEHARKKRQQEIDEREAEKQKKIEEQEQLNLKLAEERKKLQEQAEEWKERAREEADRAAEEEDRKPKKGGKKKKVEGIVSDDELSDAPSSPRPSQPEAATAASGDELSDNELKRKGDDAGGATKKRRIIESDGEDDLFGDEE